MRNLEEIISEATGLMDGIEDPSGFVHEAMGMKDRIEHLQRSLEIERANLVQALKQIGINCDDD